MPAVQPELTTRHAPGNGRLQNLRESRPVRGIEGSDEVDEASIRGSGAGFGSVPVFGREQPLNGRADEGGPAHAVDHQHKVG